MELWHEEQAPDRQIEKDLGLVDGRAIWRKPFLHDYLTGIRMLLGTTADEEDSGLTKARDEAKKNMAKAAEKLGANAVLAYHYMFVRLGLMTMEVRCFGRAVKLI